MLTDDEIRALSDSDRTELMRRLTVGMPVDRGVIRALNRRRLVLIVAAAAGATALAPWTLYLAMTLPPHYRAENWRAAWVGFDIALPWPRASR